MNMQESVNDFYSRRVAELETQLSAIKKKISFYYFVRLITFFASIGLLLLFFQLGYNYLYLSLSMASFLLFLVTIKKDIDLVSREKFVSNKIILNRSELGFLEFNFQEHATGDEFISLNPHLAGDFDLFGKGSLFQYLHRCSTKLGTRKFAENLCKSELNEEHIVAKQKAIAELTEKVEFMQDFQAFGKFLSERGDEVSGLQTWLNEEATRNKWIRFLTLFNPLLTLAWVALLVIGIFPFNSIVLVVLFNLSCIWKYTKRITSAHAKLGNAAKTFEKYTRLIECMEKERFQSDFLIHLQKQLSAENHKASHSLKKLFNLLNKFDTRYNVLVSFVLNAMVIFDIQIFYRLSNWKVKHQKVVPAWFEALSELDALISYATFAFNNREGVHYPTVSNEEFTFQAIDLDHPLIPVQTRVNNTVQFSGNPTILIITGANMAGKSTFLRTIAVNLLLAMNGAPVCAKSLHFSPCDIWSSIQIHDSLSNNESYFYAELLRIKEIIGHVANHPRTLVIFDEILRGTNTKDKQLGSLGVLENLIRQNGVVMMATHDLVIGELANKYPECVTNYCFEVELENDQLTFDYKLKPGISQKLNASFLMKKMGIID